MIEPPARQRHATPDTGPDLSALMHRAQAGDRDAYRQVLLSVTPYLRRVAARFLQRPADVDDAVQDILLTLHSVRHTYDPGRPFKPWLAGIARHRLLDRLRGYGRIAAREVAMTLQHETFAADEPNTDAGAWDVPALHSAMQTLPHGQRQAIQLMKLREMSLKEASEVSGMSVTALKVATHRGMKTLRRLLLGHGPA